MKIDVIEGDAIQIQILKKYLYLAKSNCDTRICNDKEREGFNITESLQFGFDHDMMGHPNIHNIFLSPVEEYLREL